MKTWMGYFVACVASGLMILVVVVTEARAGYVLSDDAGLAANCAPVAVIATIPRGNALEIGLDVFAMNRMAKEQFRDARLLEQSDPGSQTLIVQVHILNDAYIATLKLRRVVDFGSGRYGFAVVWEDDSAGFHGGTRDHIMGVLEGHLDRFIDSYLAVNEVACSARYGG